MSSSLSTVALLAIKLMEIRLYGVALEHAIFYQSNFHKTQNIFAGLLQTESPYYQPTPPPPAPFKSAVGVFTGDLTYECAVRNEFSGCDESWAVIIRESQNIFIASAGLYSWFFTSRRPVSTTKCARKPCFYLKRSFQTLGFSTSLPSAPSIWQSWMVRAYSPRTTSTSIRAPSGRRYPC
jgi:hypothetical protein